MKNEFVVDSLESFVKCISELRPLRDDRSKFHPMHLFYRGIPDCDFDLKPSLGRRPSIDWIRTRVYFEGEMINTAKSRYPDIFGKYDSTFELLAKLQHYGISTRLLDITSNAFVALYFACNSMQKKDGQVIVFSGRCVSRYDSFVSAVSDTYNLTKDRPLSVSRYKQMIRMQDYSYVMNMDDDFINSLQRPIFVEPGFISQRQLNQSGKFILFPNLVVNETMVTDLVTINKESDRSIVGLINIPFNKKQTILRKLERFGISSEFIFPDNIDMNCQNIVSSVDSRFKDTEIVDE